MTMARSVRQFASFIDGAAVRGEAGRTVRGVSTDSRTLQPGQLFVPLVGDRFDGHDFIATALDKGAAAVVVEPARISASLPVPVIEVEDTRVALQQMARGHVADLGVTVVAVTGSTGKTTTKDILAEMLSAWQPTIKSIENQNNDIGVPLTLLRAEPGTRFAVVEMGMRGRSEIAELCRIALPRAGIITNVGPVHIGRLGSMEAVVAAKAELIQALPRDGITVLNGDDPRLRAAAGKGKARVLWFGRSEDAAVRIVGVQGRGFDGVEVELDLQPFPGREAGRATLTIPILGRHNAYNAAAAAAVALALGCPWAAVEAGVARAGHARSGMRMDVVHLDGITVIDDAYNASPPSVKVALTALADLRYPRKAAVLGDMLELGDYARDAHWEIGQAAARAGIDVLIPTGQWAREMAEGAREAGFDAARVLVASDADQAGRLAVASARPGDIWLVKGSRGVRLERVVERLKSARSRNGSRRGDAE